MYVYCTEIYSMFKSFCVEDAQPLLSGSQPLVYWYWTSGRDKFDFIDCRGNVCEKFKLCNIANNPQFMIMHNL